MACVCLVCPHTQVPNVDTPLFWQRMDKLVDINTQLIKMDQTLPGPVASVAKMPLQIMMVSIMAQVRSFTLS